ncbi:MAG: argininosuccinate synthase [Planctomycetes bacterium]|nr:argininosuccinate synthase [Planctomycetota bacterium]
MVDRVLLSYSGGLETALGVHWLKYSKNAKVTTFLADLGQGSDLESLSENSLYSSGGAQSAHIADLKEVLLTDYAFSALRADAAYQTFDLLSAALSRPLIVSELVDLAREQGIRYIAHCSTPSGNDARRFENTVKGLAPDLIVINPLDNWRYKTREELLDEAQKFGIQYQKRRDDLLSIDSNVWGRVVEFRTVVDPSQEPSEDLFILTVSPEKAPNKAETIEIEFHGGIPVGIDGKRMSALELVTTLNSAGGRHAVGRYDVVEDRINGTKTRKLFEMPGAVILYKARRALEEITVSRSARQFKGICSAKYAELVHSGLWFNELREALDELFKRITEFVTGVVVVKLYKGQAIVTGKKSQLSLYNPRTFRSGVDPFFLADTDAHDYLASLHSHDAEDQRDGD